jgi:hypothetical protein
MFQITTAAMAAIDGQRSLPGITQAISMGIINLITTSKIGRCTRNLTSGFNSHKPKCIARIVRAKSKTLSRIKETFSRVHFLNVVEESHQLVVIPVTDSPFLQ